MTRGQPVECELITFISTVAGIPHGIRAHHHHGAVPPGDGLMEEYGGDIEDTM
jgi:hypothetical protein